MNEKNLTIRLAGRNSAPLDLEIWGGELKKGLFEETFGLNVIIVVS
jgi:hypothetical protein